VIGTGQGQPDPAFGVNGYALFSDATPQAPFMAVMADGRIVAAAFVGGCDPGCTSLQVSRYTASGGLDS